MVGIHVGRCENCNRSIKSIEVNTVTLNNHTALLCLACTHVLASPPNKDRFFQLVRSKRVQNSNQDMQKVHQMLSGFIAVGLLFLAVIAAFGIVQGDYFNTFAGYDMDAPLLKGHLTFLELKQLALK